MRSLRRFFPSAELLVHHVHKGPPGLHTRTMLEQQKNTVATLEKNKRRNTSIIYLIYLKKRKDFGTHQSQRVVADSCRLEAQH